MGRRDIDAKKQGEITDWDKLYEALLKAKEKNLVLDVKLARKKGAIDMERRQRDKTLFNDIFEQKQLAFKYRLQKRKTRQRDSHDGVEVEQVMKKEEQITPYTMPNIFEMKKENCVQSTKVKGNIEGKEKQLSLPLVKIKPTNANVPFVEKSYIDIANETQQNLKRSCTLPNLYTLYDKTSQVGSSLDEASHWVGDPEAINSVRRPRLQPEEMTDHAKPSGHARKLMIELTSQNMCSKKLPSNMEVNLPYIRSLKLSSFGSSLDIYYNST